MVRAMGSASLYGRRWRAARERFLALHPLCRLCAQQGRTVPATIVDHIVPHRGDASLFWSADNWQPVCKTCHDGTCQAKDHGKGLRGSDTYGMPLDQMHPWYREADA